MVAKRGGKSLACELFRASGLTIDKTLGGFVLLLNMEVQGNSSDVEHS